MQNNGPTIGQTRLNTNHILPLTKPSRQHNGVNEQLFVTFMFTNTTFCHLHENTCAILEPKSSEK